MHKKTYSILAAFIFAFATIGCAQKEIPLYTTTVPNAKPTADSSRMQNGMAFKVSTPTLTMYLPAADKATGTAVVICPGGGYAMLMMEGEGGVAAKYLQANGVAAFVLKYRLPDDRTMQDKSIGPLQDAQQAIRMVRMNAKEWNLDPKKVGIMGFSAGGHVASTASTHFDKALIPNPENISLRPDFSILVYPVISLSDKLAHAGSRKQLLGSTPTPEMVKLYSNDEQVTANTPPAFLIHAADDNVVDVDNSVVYMEALRRNKVPGELHVYPKGNHGFVLRWPMEEWMGLVRKWMKSGGY